MACWFSLLGGVADLATAMAGAGEPRGREAVWLLQLASENR